MSEQQTAKSYTERFKEMEEQVVELTRLYDEARQAFTVVTNIVKDLSGHINFLNEQLQAIYDLSETKQPVTRKAVTDAINKVRVDKALRIIENDKKAGVLKESPTVQSKDDLIVYSEPDTLIAFKPASAFEPEISVDELIGKKPGDVVKHITIKEVYQILNDKQAEQASSQ